MVKTLITSAVKTSATGALGTTLLGSSGVAGTIGTVATVVSAPWFLPVFIVSGVLLGGLRANIKSKNEIDEVNSYFD